MCKEKKKKMLKENTGKETKWSGRLQVNWDDMNKRTSKWKKKKNTTYQKNDKKMHWKSNQ